ncbi:glycosyltransferase family 2 protein [Spirosoma rhododendri]|nr:glycosyltransferase family 2 protein [Spirosoma rhododendri]
MATYNGAEFVAEQIDSILVQLGDNDELIISDDGSKDATVAIINGIQDKRIRLVPSQRFGSVVKNFENALRHAEGEIIFLADQDDVWYEGKVDAVIARLETCDLVLTDCRVVAQSGEVLHESFFRSRDSRPGFWRNLWKNAYQGCCMAFRRSVLTYALPFPKNIDYHDWWIGLLVELKGTPCFYDKPLLHYRRHGGNISPTGQAPQEKDWKNRLRNRFWLSWYIIGRSLQH